MDYKQFCHAYQGAKHQLNCHINQVSGCWRINGKDFCEEHGLDYEQAITYEIEKDNNDFDVFLYEERSKIEKRIGTLADEQEDRLREWCEDNWYSDEEGGYFWEDVIEQLETKYPDHYRKYEED